MGDITGLMNERAIGIEKLKFTPEDLSQLIKLINGKTISNTIGKKVLEEMFVSGKTPKVIVEEKGLLQNNDEEALLSIVKKILDSNLQSCMDYKNGKGRAIGFLVGLVMKESKGKANPQMVNKLIIEKINKL